MSGRYVRALAVGLVIVATPAWSEVSQQEAARLGNDLTPLGAEKAANQDGSIPAWDGGLTSPAKAGFPNYRTGQHHPDPFANDKPLFTITYMEIGRASCRERV